MMTDMTCLAEGMVFPVDPGMTGINANEIVVGPTGCGKSFSNAYSRLLHTTGSSVVIPVAKRAILDLFSDMFRERGYRVAVMDFAHPERCTLGYDPLDYIRTPEELVQTARNLIGGEPSRNRNGDIDPYWNDSAASVLAAEIALTFLMARDSGKKPCFADVIKLHRSIKVDHDKDLFATNLDSLFDSAEKRHPGNQAVELWKTIRDLSPRTASCIFSIVNNALDKIFSENVLAMTKKDRRVNFRKLGEKRTALFIVTSPMNRSLNNLINMMYADMFRVLFETAESRESGALRIPVHIICDDFACGSRIQDFEDYISIFRAAGISVTLLLQSESQLSSMYGSSAAVTIINNCDTYVYMGGMDIETCEHISRRMNKPLDRVMSLPLEQVVVFRRGSQPAVARRYQTMEDPVYRELLEKRRGRENCQKEPAV